jgi:hypothetical protein
MRNRPHGTEEQGRQIAEQRAAEAVPAQDAVSAPDPATVTWARAQLREQIQRAGAALAPTAQPTNRQQHEMDRSPLADREPEP